MKYHAAFGLDIEDLDIVIVEDSKPMQAIIRSIVSSFKVARVRAFDTVDEALQSMIAEPPNVILTDLRMKPTSGYQMLKLIRHRHMDPLCYVPILFLTAHGTLALVEKSLRAGAHHVLAKPVSPSTLYKRLKWLIRDDRPLVLQTNGFYNIEGINDVLDQQTRKILTYENAQLHQQEAIRQLIEVRGTLAREFERPGKDDNFVGEGEYSSPDGDERFGRAGANVRNAFARVRT
ncbi:MAG: response regulator [Rhodobacteraceae bacterium]|nr:response regulator [Paracoccaceae bacterium]